MYQHHPLLAQSIGAQREIVSMHFGQPGRGKKVYIQAGLHADEHPGMLTLHHLKTRLQALDAAGQLHGEIVLVPMANPIGLNNFMFGRQMGRFELSSRENFNRHYIDLAELVREQIATDLSDDAEANVQLIRQCMRERLHARHPSTELESLRLTLMRLACDADVVLDVHCDSEAMVHLYVHSTQQEQARVLAGYTGSYATLHATEQGGNSFDEAYTNVWYKLQQAFPEQSIPMATFAATVELRGINDVSHELASADAEGLLNYLTHLGVVAGLAPVIPELVCEPTPLSGVEVLNAPHAGLVAYRVPVGQWVEPGTPLVDVINPLNGQTSTLTSSIAGMFFARVIEHFSETHSELTFVAGHTPLREGCLLGA